MGLVSSKFIRVNKLNIAVFIFLILFTTVHITKPVFIYTNKGGFRPFGIGYKHKTVVPIWLVAIILAFLSYLSVLYLIMFC
jgi:hypothetical protein